MELNLAEKKMLAALQIVRSYLTQRFINRKEYLTLMDTVKLAIQTGINKEYGCPTGLHADTCLCTENKESQTLSSIKHKMNRIRREDQK